MERGRIAEDPSRHKLQKPPVLQKLSMWGLLPQDHEYRCMQTKFVDNLILMNEKDDSFKKQLQERCGIVAGDPDTYSKLQDELKGASFDFSSYLSLQLAEAVSDSIEIHSVSWIVVWILLLISSFFYLFASMSLPVVTLCGIMPLTLAWFVGCWLVFRRQQIAMAKTSYRRATSYLRSAQDLEALVSQQLKDTADACLQGRRVLRVAQIICIACSYVLARLLFSPPDWQTNFSITLVATMATGALWVIMMLWLKFHSPVFLALLSLPPHFTLSNDKAMKNFWRAFKPKHALMVKPLEKITEVSVSGTHSLAPLREDPSARGGRTSGPVRPSPLCPH
jgi:hypothetical protein